MFSPSRDGWKMISIELEAKLRDVSALFCAEPPQICYRYQPKISVAEISRATHCAGNKNAALSGGSEGNDAKPRRQFSREELWDGDCGSFRATSCAQLGRLTRGELGQQISRNSGVSSAGCGEQAGPILCRDTVPLPPLGNLRCGHAGHIGGHGDA
ncbi:hypothetical protein [Bradyrhizobium sp. Arg816]|uniref:hypothetical protein n=1 Tax=Bradyrhizobium sp. Arg816 TaxID=2998491 RepID=UPI00249E7EE0|nr:hypothetical protein [Bradyrhizobium sp. Arg816]MDI3563534.1 hypothetical protein [Bradyrhizobium sp. Arg816]